MDVPDGGRGVGGRAVHLRLHVRQSAGGRHAIGVQGRVGLEHMAASAEGAKWSAFGCKERFYLRVEVVVYGGGEREWVLT